MTFPRPRVTGALMLTAGLVLGWALAGVKAPALHATGSGDRSGESILAAGPVMVRYNDGLKVQMTQDALYYLDYKTGRLLATIPSYRQSAGTAKYLDAFAERDLVADFTIDLDHGPRPHCFMTTGALGIYSDGSAPLFVFESTTSQVAVYRVQQQTVGTITQPRFELIEIRSFARNTAPAAR